MTTQNKQDKPIDLDEKIGKSELGFTKREILKVALPILIEIENYLILSKTLGQSVYTVNFLDYLKNIVEEKITL